MVLIYQQELSPGAYQAALDFSSVLAYGMCTGDFLDQYDSMSPFDLEANIKSQLNKMLSILSENEELHEFYDSIGMQADLTGVLKVLGSI